jgi:hypothetical protein
MAEPVGLRPTAADPLDPRQEGLGDRDSSAGPLETPLLRLASAIRPEIRLGRISAYHCCVPETAECGRYSKTKQSEY